MDITPPVRSDVAPSAAAGGGGVQANERAGFDRSPGEAAARAGARANGGAAPAVDPAETPSPSQMGTFVTLAAAVGVLYLAQEVLIPIILAVLLTFVLSPVVRALRRVRVPRGMAVLLAVALGFSVILGLGAVIGRQVSDLAGDIPRYQATILNKTQSLQGLVLDRLGGLSRVLSRVSQRPAEGAPTEGVPAPATPATEASGAPRAAPPAERPVLVEVRQPEASPFEVMRAVLGPVVHPLATFGIVVVVVIFVLAQREDLRDRLIRLFGSGDLHRTTAAMDDAARRLSRYFLMQLLLNGIFGVMITVGLWLIGVPNPVLWGIVAALSRFVPYIGVVVAVLPPLLLAAAVDPGWSMALWTLALFAVTEPLMGHGVEPMVYGKSTGLSPVAVVIAAIFWTWLWGPIGLLLSTPLTLCLVVLGRHVERLEFLDVLFGDRPALTPVEGFYQRMLAGDVDEAAEQAETFLADHPLGAYYDEVALPGLQLAASDARRGALGRGGVGRMREAMLALVDDLAAHEDDAPGGDDAAAAPPPPPLKPEWCGPAPALCVAGRGPLDDAAAAMLAQLLERRGIGARRLPHEAVSSAALPALDAGGAAMILVSYLDIAGAPAHVRYLVRRLKRRFPGVPVLVGVWPAADAVLTNDALRGSLGADLFATSLRGAVDACLAAARAPEAEGTAAPVPDEAPAPRSRPAAAPVPALA